MFFYFFLIPFRNFPEFCYYFFEKKISTYPERNTRFCNTFKQAQHILTDILISNFHHEVTFKKIVTFTQENIWENQLRFNYDSIETGREFNAFTAMNVYKQPPDVHISA